MMHMAGMAKADPVNDACHAGSIATLLVTWSLADRLIPSCTGPKPTDYFHCCGVEYWVVGNDRPALR